MSTLNTLRESIKNYFEMVQAGTTLIWQGLLEALNITLTPKGDK